MLKVSYKEFEKNAMNPYWTGWNDLFKIEKILKKSRYYDDPCEHLYCFLNNYWLEQEVKDLLNLKYKTGDHEYLIESQGKNIADFRDENGIDYELKQSYDFNALNNIPERDWHNTTVKLFYCRKDQTLYQKHFLNKDWTPIAQLNVKHINPYYGLKKEDIDKAQHSAF